MLSCAAVIGRFGCLCAIAWVCVLLAGPPMAVAGSDEATSASVPASHPLLEFPVTHVDLGPIDDRRPITTTFQFTNISGRPARLVMSGCHFCGLPTSDKAVYQPGEKGVIFLTLEPSGRRGPARAIGGIGVEGSVPGRVGPEGPVSLLVTAEIRPPVFAEPPQMMIPEFVRGQSPAITFTVSGRNQDGRAEFAITDFTTGIEQATLTVSPGKRTRTDNDDYTTYTMTVRLGPDVPLGEVGMPIRLATNHPDVSVLEYPISTTVRGQLVAVPDPVIVGVVRPGAAFAAECVVSSRTGMEAVVPSEIDIVTAGLCSGVILDAQPGPGALWWRVRVQGIAPQRELMHDQIDLAITGRTADGAVETIPVAVRMGVRLEEPKASTP